MKLKVDSRRRACTRGTGSRGLAPAESPEIRAQLTAEIDALVAHEVFGLTRDELRYVLDPDSLLGEGVAWRRSKRSATARSGGSANIGPRGSCWRRGTVSSAMAHLAIARSR